MLNVAIPKDGNKNKGDNNNTSKTMILIATIYRILIEFNIAFNSHNITK